MRTRDRATSRSPSGGGAARALATCARPAALVGVGPCPTEAHCSRETALSVVHGHAPTCQPRPPNEQTEFACAHTRSRHLTLSLRKRRSTGACCDVRAPRCAGWSRSMPYGSPLQQRDGPFRRARPCSDMPAATSKRADGVSVCAHTIAPPHALSQEEAQHARLRRVHAPPRWLALVHIPWKPTAPARRPPPSVHGRASACQSRPSNEQTEFKCAHTRLRRRTLSLRRRLSTRACDVRAPRRAGWSRSMPYGSPLHQREGPLRRCTAVLRHASRGLQTSSLLSHVR